MADEEPPERMLWNKQYGRDLSEAEHGEIEQSLSGFFSLLDQWDQAETDTTGRIEQQDGTPCKSTKPPISTSLPP